MQRVDGNYLYQVGSQLHPLASFAMGIATWTDIYVPVIVAEGALEPLITRTVFQLRTSVQTGGALLGVLREIQERIGKMSVEESKEPVDYFVLHRLTTALAAFEAVLAAELQLIPLFVVTPKRGLALSDLIDAGYVCFPSDLPFKVPAALSDAQEATKCIAFELPTAAGFHLHRANEAVVRAYFGVVAKGIKPPRTRNMGDYLKKLTEAKVGDPKVIAALTQLKDLHRNPLMHPDERLEHVEDAISLLGAVRSAMTEMLKPMPYVLPAGAAGAVDLAQTAPI